MMDLARRLGSLLIVMILIVSFCVPALAANTMQQGSMYVNTSNGKALRFRSSKSTSAHNILDEIPYGTKVYVSSWDGTWARIRYNSAVGYVVRKHLSIARPDPFEEVQARQEAEAAARQKEKELKAANNKLDHSRVKTGQPYDVTVRTGVSDLSVNIYEKPSLLSAVTGSCMEGDRLAVAGQNRDWALIYDGSADRSGYMLLEDLEPDVVEDELLEDE
jgi:uncharacterized protein YgiM (DUF1202 family)